MIFKPFDLTKTYIAPKRGTKNAAGYDIFSSEDIIIPSLFNCPIRPDASNVYMDLNSVTKVKEPWQATLVSTNVSYEIDSDKFIGVYSRSSVSSKGLLLLANGVGVADADYSGEIKVPLLNLSPYDIVIHKGDKIAQIIIQSYGTVENEEKTQVVREGGNEGGFGSTGN